MTFSMSFPNILRRMIGQNILGLLYNVLLGFRMIIDIDFLKCKGQYPRLMCEFAMLTMYLLSPTNALRYLQEI